MFVEHLSSTHMAPIWKEKINIKKKYFRATTITSLTYLKIKRKTNYIPILVSFSSMLLRINHIGICRQPGGGGVSVYHWVMIIHLFWYFETQNVILTRLTFVVCNDIGIRSLSTNIFLIEPIPILLFHIKNILN